MSNWLNIARMIFMGNEHKTLFKTFDLYSCRDICGVKCMSESGLMVLI